MISVDPTQTSLLIPPHYPPDLYHRPQISLATDTDKGNDFTVKKQKSATFTNESIEDSELLLTLHRQMYRQIPLPHPPKDQAEDDISLTDLPSELIRQGLDDTVNMKDSVGEWRDR